MRSAALLSVLAFFGIASTTPVDGKLQARAIVPHDSIGPVLPKTQGGKIGNAMERFQPFLHIAHGCQPYTASNEQVDISVGSGGLQDSGNPSAGCRDRNKGQTYVRGAWHKGKFGLMYAWYFPKDQPNAGNVVGGHRHDWENVVVWIDNPDNANPRIVGFAASGHGDYSRTTNPIREGDKVKVEYFTQLGLNHALQMSNTRGDTHWLLQWESMDARSRNALQNANFGKANVPFKDGNFFNNLDKAFI
ncbi:hypothetical protein MRS44_003720 [Fusarium solani]|uniref:uncharacterized protein n=1 Tax=Fusarium solani TaxID=169388 RepID=UPI0032C3D863|nr:hypothetical protein MRS44_003720 [Fusarium solani]